MYVLFVLSDSTLLVLFFPLPIKNYQLNKIRNKRTQLVFPYLDHTVCQYTLQQQCQRSGIFSRVPTSLHEKTISRTETTSTTELKIEQCSQNSITNNILHFIILIQLINLSNSHRDVSFLMFSNKMLRVCSS